MCEGRNMVGHFQIQILQECPPAITFKGSFQENKSFSQQGRKLTYKCENQCTRLKIDLIEYYLDIHERLKQIHGNRQISWCEQTPASKNLKSSVAAREAGAVLTKNGEVLAAVTKLNSAMRLVPVSRHEEIGWIAATRSAATYLLGLSEECYQDCKLALECLPLSLTLQRFKLWDRAATCCSLMGRSKEASDAFEAASEELKQSSIAEHIREKLLQTMKDNLEKGKNTEGKSKSKEQPTLDNLGENTMVSKKVSVVHNEGVGRHVKAVEDIAVGEVIVQENPISSVLHLSKLETNCSNCMVPAIAGIACDSCTEVIFCSRECRMKAGQTFHKVECGHLLIFPPLGPLCPAFRLITSRSLELVRAECVRCPWLLA